jgi:uncharacterized protein (DUF952 family)/mannose-6-phosphate isomerase-like protein (cupin superfamily)
MPTIIGKSVTAVESEDGALIIEELAGNVATRDDTLSIATVTVSKPTREPWLTLDYDEWICVTSGKIELHFEQDKVLEVNKGQTVFVGKGERFQPVFPVGGTSYIPVCLPAFRPDRCIREEEENGSHVAVMKLQELHSNTTTPSNEKPPHGACSPTNEHHEEEVLYHMCQKSLWEEAVVAKKAYFPPTFQEDGMFTHATAVPQRLVTTANHFYTATAGDWICLQLSRSALYNIGIDTIFEEAKPVGEASVGDAWGESWICPHIYGGIPTTLDGIVTQVYDMERDEDGTFISIIGLTNK